MPGIVTVTESPASATLTTLANAKAELNVSTTTDDTYIASLIARASSMLARHCGRPFGAITVSETFRFGWQPGIGPTSQQVAPYGTPLNVQYKPLILTYIPVVMGTDQITENGTLLTAGTDYELDTGAGLVYRLRNGLRSWWGVPNVVAAYQGGYLLPNDATPQSPTPSPIAMPADLEAMCLALVAAAYAGRGRDPAVQSDQVEGVGRVIYQRTSGIANMVIDEPMAAELETYRIRAW